MMTLNERLAELTTFDIIWMLVAGAFLLAEIGVILSNIFVKGRTSYIRRKLKREEDENSRSNFGRFL